MYESIGIVIVVVVVESVVEGGRRVKWCVVNVR
jgi:hypothetical protein